MPLVAGLAVAAAALWAAGVASERAQAKSAEARASAPTRRVEERGMSGGMKVIGRAES
jgi:hypothetical protein